MTENSETKVPGSRPSAAEWDLIFARLKGFLEGRFIPLVSEMARKDHNPFHFLIATLISLRTKDAVTAEASARLFAKAATPEAIRNLSEEEIANLIYPAGFYRNKARQIKETCRILVEQYGGRVPGNEKALLALPGVGRKTANLTLNLGFGVSAICVDIHVHRISNRIGWVVTRNPEETEFALMEILPEKYWMTINEYLVSYGQNICTPQSPHCSSCVINDLCLRRGVSRSR